MKRQRIYYLVYALLPESEIVDLFEDLIGSLLGILGSDLLDGRLLLLFFLRTVNRDHRRENQSWNKK